MVTEKLEQIISKLCEAKEDSEKAESGNVSAGTRLRKAALEATKLLKELRVDVLSLRKSRD